VRIGCLSDLIRAKVSRITDQWTWTPFRLPSTDVSLRPTGPPRDLIRAKVSRITAQWMRTPSCVPLIDAR
jgi:hypothetical protein